MMDTMQILILAENKCELLLLLLIALLEGSSLNLWLDCPWQQSKAANCGGFWDYDVRRKSLGAWKFAFCKQIVEIVWYGKGLGGVW